MKLTNQSFVLLGLFFVSLFACTTRERVTDPKGSQPLVRLSEGDYLSSTYVETLKRTRSPFEAGKTGRINRVVVHRKGSKLLLEPIFSFHESGVVFAIHDDGAASCLESCGEDTRNLTASVVDELTFRLGFGELEPVTYVFVNNASEYVSRAALVGKYYDRQRRTYEFSQDGWAVFPDRRFRFEIGVDHVLNGFDYFMDSTTMWAFKRNRNELQIFATSDVDGPEQIRPGPPYLSLREVR